MAQKLRVGLVFGGQSCEHAVSIISARGILAALDRQTFDVTPLYIDPTGHWHWSPTDALPADLAQHPWIRVALLPIPHQAPVNLDDPTQTLPRLDVIFSIVHGTQGEDGVLQGLFELAAIPYVGSGVLGSAVGMDKAAMKAAFAQAELPQAPYCVVMAHQWAADPAAVQADCERRLDYPWFVKPANAGSSVGIHKVHHAGEFAAAMDDAARYDRKLVIEAGIENAREIELAVLGNATVRVSVAGEIVPCNEFYDYAAKYLDDRSQLFIPAVLPAQVLKRLQEYAARAFVALDCLGMARVDFLVRRNDDAIFILEANTLPGFTPISMYPKLWAASGLAYGDLLCELIALARDHHDQQQQRCLAFNPPTPPSPPGAAVPDGDSGETRT